MKAKIIPAENAVLLPYQRKWIKDRFRLKIAEKSRQIGWTWATAASLVYRKCLRGSRLDAWYIPFLRPASQTTIFRLLRLRTIPAETLQNLKFQKVLASLIEI